MESFCSLSSNIEFTDLYFYSHFLMHLNLLNFLSNFSTITLYKLAPFANWHIIRLDSLISSSLNPSADTFIPQLLNTSYTAWLFYHKVSICSFSSPMKSLLVSIPNSMSLPLALSFSFFSLPEGLRILSLFWIFLATSV